MYKAYIPGIEGGGGNIVVSLILLGRLHKRITEVDYDIIFMLDQHAAMLDA